MKILTDGHINGKETVKDIFYKNPHSYGCLELDESKCTGCEACAGSCIAGAISFDADKPSFDNKKCIFCRDCLSACSSSAISMSDNCMLAETAGPAQLEALGNELKSKIYKTFHRSLTLRSVDTGSCNACMLELSATQNTFYDLSRFGIGFAASPRHSDGIVVTGPVAINMKEALLKTYHAMPEPRLVIAVGACAHDGGIFKDTHGNCGALSSIIPVDLIIPGCPPSPQAIIYGFLKLMDRI